MLGSGASVHPTLCSGPGRIEPGGQVEHLTCGRRSSFSHSTSFLAPRGTGFGPGAPARVPHGSGNWEIIERLLDPAAPAPYSWERRDTGRLAPYGPWQSTSTAISDQLLFASPPRAMLRQRRIRSFGSSGHQLTEARNAQSAPWTVAAAGRSCGGIKRTRSAT